MERRRHRPGEIDAIYFDQLPTRCKEMFFEYLDYDFEYTPKDFDKSIYSTVCGFYLPDEIKSPIEQMFYFAFSILSCCLKGFNIELAFQTPIKANGNNYRADFLFDTNICANEDGQFDGYNQVKIIIECDGHEFHEKTKEQVAHGNKRDYDLKVAGYDVIHYSGSQIYNEPFKCAKEVLDYIVIKLGDKESGGEKDVHTKNN